MKHIAMKLLMAGLILILVMEFVGCYSPKETGEAPPEAKKVTKGLIAYLPFNGNANDEISAENNGTVNGAVLTKDRFNKANCAYKFDGENDYISIPVNINPDEMPELTLVAWVKPDDISPIRQVISHDDAGFDRSLGIDGRGGGEGWSAFIGSGAVLGYHPVKKGKWILLSVAYNQADSTVKLYVNNDVYKGKGFCGQGREDTYIGTNPTSREFFSGVIDDVRIYNRVLTKKEINTIYQEGGWTGN
ncbi:LamG domain-containing protein [candidate division WOR-3 bacterium]|nr:LamG domain-containing protein [candidate division WOR-3 bacterium]